MANNVQRHFTTSGDPAAPSVSGDTSVASPCGRAAARRCAALPLVLALMGAAAVAAALVAGCDGAAQRFASPAPPDSVTVLFSADNEGVLSSCGCSTSPAGGFARRQTVIDDFRRARRSVVVVDAGDMFHDRPNTIKARYLAMALGRAGYDAVAMGTLDFELGVDQVRSLAREYKLPFICANVRDGSGGLVFPPHVVRQAGKMRVGIFAVIADQAYGSPPREWRKGLRVEPPIDAARREVRDLAGCDLIVALSNQPLEKTRALASGVAGIHVIVSGHDETVLRQPAVVESTMIVGTGAVGRLLGSLTVTRGPEGKPEMQMEMMGLSAKVDEAKWVMGLYWEYVRKAKDEPPPEWNQMAVPDKYQAADACMHCHEAEYRQWETTPHADAYAALKKAGKQDDPECLLCHTMGYGREGGFISMEKTPELGRLTCQACHVVVATHGSKSGADPNAKLDVRSNVNSRLCMSCHGLIESPDFDYITYRPKVVHGSPPPAKAPAQK